MGVKTTVAAISYAANHQANATKAGQNVISLNADILLQTQELIISLTRLQATMVTGDGNIATINTLITALS